MQCIYRQLKHRNISRIILHFYGIQTKKLYVETACYPVIIIPFEAGNLESKMELLTGIIDGFRQ